MVPLITAGNGDTGSIVRITGRDETRRHLAEQGFVVGADVTVLNRVGGSMILAVKDSRVALDQTMAARISVDPR